MGKPNSEGQKVLVTEGNVDARASRVIKKTKPWKKRTFVPTDVVLRNNIPDVLRWVREQIDAEKQSRVEAKRRYAKQTLGHVGSARAFARLIRKRNSVRILLNGCDYWKGETRLWENVCALSAKLPGEGRGNNIFDAMSRYPSSTLVYQGLKSIYGRNAAVKGTKTPRFSIRENAINLFCPTVSEETIAKKWFEPDTFTRMQEAVIHMSAISEYILRCAYTCLQARSRLRSRESELFSLLDARIKEDRDYKNRRVLRFDPCDAPDELCAEFASSCFEKATRSAHSAVAQGAKVASRKYGRKEGYGKERGRIQLWMLKRPLPEVMDALIRNLEEVVTELFESKMDVEEFRFRTMRLLRKVEAIYEDVGSLWFSNERNFQAPCELPKNTESLVSSGPYTLLHFSR